MSGIMKNKFLNILFIGIIALTSSSYAGYVGDLPQIGIEEKPSDSAPDIKGIIEVKEVKPEVPTPNLAPKNYPDIYAGVLAKQGKYTQYLKDLDDIIPSIESIIDVINDRNSNSLQIFSAKANLISLYVNSLEKKYSTRPERNYESYKQLIKLNKLLSDVAYYWKSSLRYQRIAHGGLNSKLANDKIINQKLDNALKAIKLTLEIIKEN